jgi:adenylate cyclase
MTSGSSTPLAVQDEVARAIVATLAAHVNCAETERALLKPPAAWEAYDHYLRGAEAFFLWWNGRTKASLYDARRLLEQSLAIDPDYARACAMLSRTHRPASDSISRTASHGVPSEAGPSWRSAS